jgi:hypothetical protein
MLRFEKGLSGDLVACTTKEQTLGVDTPEQQVQPCVQYGTTCLLIRNIMGSVSCLIVREGYRDFLRAPRCKRGHGTTYYLKKP